MPATPIVPMQSRSGGTAVTLSARCRRPSCLCTGSETLMPRKKLDLSWMGDQPKKLESDDKEKRKKETPPEPPTCVDCGDADAWWGYRDEWRCRMCVPDWLRYPTVA